VVAVVLDRGGGVGVSVLTAALLSWALLPTGCGDGGVTMVGPVVCVCVCVCVYGCLSTRYSAVRKPGLQSTAYQLHSLHDFCRHPLTPLLVGR
jgi:hypothetical protein